MMVAVVLLFECVVVVVVEGINYYVLMVIFNRWRDMIDPRWRA